MRIRPRQLMLAAGVAACLLVVWLPVGSPMWEAIARGSGVGAVVVSLVAVWPMRGPARNVWWGLVGFQVLTVGGDVIYDILANVLDVEPFPSAADALYLGAYVCLLWSLARLVTLRLPGHDREAWVDSAIMTVAAVTTVGTFVILPMLVAAPTSAVAFTVALSYPILDLVVLATVIRLMVGGGPANPALGLVVASMALTLGADLVFANLVELGAVESASGWVDALFLAGVLLLTAAVTAPGAEQITQPRAEGRTTMTRGRAAGLGVGVMTPSVVLAGFAWRAGDTPVRLLACASMVVVLLGLWRILMLTTKVAAQGRLLAEQARTDSLTGLPNRRTWDYEVQRISDRSQLAGIPLTVAILDLDHFKATNDTLGHPAGDRILRSCSHAWQRALGAGTVLARYGGEEFAVALPGFTAERAAALLDRTRRATPDAMTVSIGIAEQLPNELVDATFARADLALYRAKTTGRDRVTIHQPDPVG